jgi:hypothetical protein
MSDETFADWLLRVQQEPGATPQRVIDRMFTEWGGARIYVAKKNSPEELAYRAGTLLAAGMSMRQMIDELGCSRRTGFRLVNRRWRSR